MWKWIIGLVAAWWLLFSGGCSVTEEAGKAWQSMGGAAVTTVEGLEASGADYEVRLDIPGEANVSWTPFGFEIEIPQSRLNVFVKSGRGKGARPTDVTPPAE